MQRNRIAQSSKVDKTINYLRRSDLRGLAKEVAEYTRWRSNVGFGWKMDPILIFRDVITKYGIGQNSQFGEGSVLRQLLTKYPVPFLVDVGAHDGRSWSNSRPFMLQGWHGILIEPLPKVYQELSSLYQHNSKATCLNLACSDTTGEQPLFIGADGDIGMGSTLCADENEWFNKMRTNQTINVKTDTLTNILDESDWPREFGLLLVDAEGMDYEVLCGLDFTRYRPAVIVTEEYVSNRAKHVAKYELLRRQGYQLFKVIGETNSVWTSS